MSVPPVTPPVEGDPSNTGARQLRKTSDESKLTSWDQLDEDVEGIRSYGIEEKLLADKYQHPLVETMDSGRSFSISYLQNGGFKQPVHVPDKSELDLKVPLAKTFGVAEVRASVGSRRCIDVMDCRTQKNISMTMKEWHKYFEVSIDPLGHNHGR